MAKVNTYLNFPGNMQEPFLFYKSVFGGEFQGGNMRMGNVPAQPGDKPMSDDQKKHVMHVSLPMQDMFWGDYFGDCTDKFGVQWMFAYSKEK